MKTLFFTTACAVALAACSAEDTIPGDQAMAEPEAAPPAAEPMEPAPETSMDEPELAGAESETMGGDGSEIVLTGLTSDDIQGASLEGELGCSFTAEGGDAPLLVAMANVGDEERSHGVIKVGDYPENLTSRTPGGFGALTEGTGFAGRGMTLDIALMSGDLAEHEGSEHEATLTADRADGARRTWDGVWTCGP